MSRTHDLQRALELTHYARRHHGARFVIALGGPLHIADFMLDLKLLSAYGLQGLLVVRAAMGDSRRLLERAQAGGVPLTFLDATTPDALVEAAVAAFARGETPVVVTPDPSSPDPPGPAKRLATQLAIRLKAKRLFLVVPPGDPALEPTRPHVTIEEVRALRDLRSARCAFWALTLEALMGGVAGVCVLPGEAGCLFEELFTHEGRGLLLGNAIEEVVRQATFSEAADLHLLLKHEISRGLVRSVDEHAVACTVDEHLVYTIDGVIVGTARLAPHGDYAELSRFATLPRYRGRGRARTLGEALVNWGIEEDYDALFALSVDARMWRFFESLGFSAVSRRALPKSWQSNYDFERPSRAFLRRL